MEVQTQVMDETAVADEIYNQQSVADYKDALSQIRVARVVGVQQIEGLASEIRGLMDSRANLIAMYQSEAVAMYPELQGQDIYKILDGISTAHPLYQLWTQYKPKIDDLAQTVTDKFKNLDELNKAANDLANQEAVVLHSYDTFYSSATTPIPTPAQILAELQAVEVIPYVEEGTLRAELPAIERLSPSAAAMVTLQTLEVANEGDYSESPEQTETQENAQLRPMAFSFDEYQGSPTLPQVMSENAVAQAIASQPVLPAPTNAHLQKWGVWVGAAALAYLFFGGKKS